MKKFYIINRRTEEEILQEKKDQAELKEFQMKVNKLIDEFKETKKMIIDDIITDDPDYEIIKDHFKLQVKAVELFSKDTCFICDAKVDFKYPDFIGSNGRMFNIEDSRKLNPDHWITLCLKCNKKMVERLEENVGFVPYED